MSRGAGALALACLAALALVVPGLTRAAAGASRFGYLRIVIRDVPGPASLSLSVSSHERRGVPGEVSREPIRPTGSRIHLCADQESERRAASSNGVSSSGSRFRI